MQPSVSQAKINANRLNAQKSKGPRTPEGRTKSAANSTRHGLQASPATIFENNPTEQTQFEALHAQLFHQCLPTGDLEVQAFERYAFATFQSQRARKMETSTQDRWLNEPTNQIFFLQMERFTKLSALQERRADRA